MIINPLTGRILVGAITAVVGYVAYLAFRNPSEDESSPAPTAQPSIIPESEWTAHNTAEDVWANFECGKEAEIICPPKQNVANRRQYCAYCRSADGKPKRIFSPVEAEKHAERLERERGVLQEPYDDCPYGYIHLRTVRYLS